jgi:L-ascorbate metabolism protein UlaG (beta-lactamase superfamily)
MPLMHASLRLEFAGKVIDIDPTGDYQWMPKSDLILITDIHGDHMQAAAVNVLKKPGTVVIAAPEVAKTITEAKLLANGAADTVNLSGTQIRVEAVPSYNLTRGPAEGQLYHTKGRGNGYILTLGGKRIYAAGDTECVPEVKALRNIDVAFLPMNLPFTQTPQEAAECVKAFRPKVVYPYHYRGQDTKVFADALRGESGIEVRLREWY